jgi:hypothetical protein
MQLRPPWLAVSFFLGGKLFTRSKVMTDDRVMLRRNAFQEIRSAALAELERRGYEVRGKTPAQIRQILKRRPTKPNPTLSQIASLQNT